MWYGIPLRNVAKRFVVWTQPWAYGYRTIYLWFFLSVRSHCHRYIILRFHNTPYLPPSLTDSVKLTVRPRYSSTYLSDMISQSQLFANFLDWLVIVPTEEEGFPQFTPNSRGHAVVWNDWPAWQSVFVMCLRLPPRYSADMAWPESVSVWIRCQRNECDMFWSLLYITHPSPPLTARNVIVENAHD